MGKTKSREQFSIDAVITSLKERGINSFAQWIAQDCNQVEKAANVFGNKVSTIAKTMGWPSAKRYGNGVTSYLRLLTKSEIERAIRANLTPDKKRVHRYLSQKLYKLGYGDLIRQIVGRKDLKEWYLMTDDEVIEYIRKNKIKSMAEAGFGLSAHLRRPDKAELFTVVADMFLRHARTNKAKEALEKGIKDRENGALKDPVLARQALDRFKSEFFPAQNIWTAVNHRVYCRCARLKGALMFREHFQIACCIFAGAFEKKGYEKQRAEYFYLEVDDIKTLIDSFLITQKDLEALPGFFEFLYRKGLEEYPKGEGSIFEKNLKNMHKRRMTQRPA